MALWGNTDEAASAPKNLSADELANTYFVDTTEALVAENIAKGLNTPGWSSYQTHTTNGGTVTRHVSEVLVAMSETAADAGDLGVEGDTLVEDATVADV